MNLLLKEIKSFSRENWWIFILLIIALTTVYITGNGNLMEITILFFANFIGNVFIMMMQNNYTKGKNKEGSSYYIVALCIFIFIGIYGFVFLKQSQYIIWQVAYTLAGVKSFIYYNYHKNLKFLSEKTFFPFNTFLFIIFLLYFPHENYSILQAVGFSLITTGLVSIKDDLRYWLNVVGIGALTFGSLWGVVNSFNLGNLDGVALGFFCLTGTVFIYYLKLLKKYI